MTTATTHTIAGGEAVRPTRRRVVLRWMASFAGFPLGGLVAIVLTGPVDSLGSALAGGLLTGVVLGVVQAWAMGRGRVPATAWAIVTGAGLMAGLGLGASLVDYRTDLGSLVLQGAVTGIAVGAAQAVVLRPRLGSLAWVWPVLLGASWAAGWAVTTAIGVQVEDRFTVFGSAGAVTVALLTTVLPLLLNRHAPRPTERRAS